MVCADMWGQRSQFTSTQEAQGSTLLSAKAKGGISRPGSLCLTLVGRGNWGPERRGTDPGDWWIWWGQDPRSLWQELLCLGSFRWKLAEEPPPPCKVPEEPWIRRAGVGGQEVETLWLGEL